MARKKQTGPAQAERDHHTLYRMARAAMRDSHPDEIVALLKTAEKVKPTRNPQPLRPEVRDAVLAANADFTTTIRRLVEAEREDEASSEWTRKKLAETFTRRTNLDVYTGTLLSKGEMVVTRVTGHGIQRPEQIPSLHGVRPWAGAR